jgi:hypothetical protein
MSEEKIAATCPGCGAHVRAPRQALGKRVKCPRCAQPFVVADPAAEPEPEPAAVGSAATDDLFAGLAAGTAVESADEQRARLEARLAEAARVGRKATEKRAPQEAATDEPARSSGGGLGPWVVGFGRALIPLGYASRLNCAAIVIGVGLFMYGVKVANVRANSRTEPQTLTCEELLTRGPGDNLHVVLTDFVLLPEYVYEAGVGGWNGAWVPTVSHELLQAELASVLKVQPTELASVSEERRRDALHKLKWSELDVKLIVCFRHARSEADVESQLVANELHGTLLRDQGLGGLSSKKRAMLADTYARAHLADCWVLEEGLTPATAANAAAYQWGGGALLIGGLAVAALRAASMAKTA